MSGAQTVKDLDKKSRVVEQSFEYFPLWYFRQANPQGEDVVLQPAAATSVTELKSLHVPAGDLRRYEPALDAQSVAPSVPLEAALAWLPRPAALPSPADKAAASGTAGISSGVDLREMSLVHVPVYLFKYEYRAQRYAALVDAASGTVLANLFPAKAEAPYLLVGGVTALVFLCLALAPVIGGLAGDESGLSIGLAVCAGAGVIAAPILFAWAFWVASKI